MYVEQHGDGEPEIALIGAIHGDEPCGAAAIETLLDEQPAVERPVKCIIANERALDQECRYTETDLNRAFPGTPTAELYEPRLAHELLTEVRECTALTLHSTQSTDQPFALVSDFGANTVALCSALSIDAIVDVTPCVDTGLGSYIDAIEVECGRQGSTQATAHANRLVREFLAATGALPGGIDPPNRSLPMYRLSHPIGKPPADTYTVSATNFEWVPDGTPYATHNDTPLRADEPFYPVLMSPYGYDTQLGYAAELAGQVR